MAQETAVGINNAFYDDLGELWENGCSHPVALLRAENRVRNPWIFSILQKHKGLHARVLDIGCGGGLLTNYLAEKGMHSIEGVDLSQGSLDQARRNDPGGKVIYRQANALCLPHADSAFDAVFAMDILEHVEYPEQLISEASRVLQPGGLFFFHTFNRTFASWLTAIKSLEWFVENSPSNIHIYRLFIRPQELSTMCHAKNLELTEMHGLKPCIFQLPLLKMLLTGRVDPRFAFRFTSSLSTGYCGFAKKLNLDKNRHLA